MNHASGMKRSITAAGRGQQRTTVGKASRPASLVRADEATSASQLTTAESEQWISPIYCGKVTVSLTMAESTACSVLWLVGSRWSPHPRALARQADSPFRQSSSADRAQQRLYSTCVIQRYSNRKTCLSKRKMVSTLTSCDVDHVLKWTRLSVRISAMGSKVMRIYCTRRTESLGTRLLAHHIRAFPYLKPVMGIFMTDAHVSHFKQVLNRDIVFVYNLADMNRQHTTLIRGYPFRSNVMA